MLSFQQILKTAMITTHCRFQLINSLLSLIFLKVMSQQKFKQVCLYLFNKSQQMRYLNQQAAHLCYAAIGERGVMKTKIIGIALVFGLFAGGLGACTPADDGVTPSPAESPTISPTTTP